MIYTVTLNPALDKTVEIPSFTTDGVNRITSIRTDPGGKGINVSKVVAALGSTSRALGILGGSTGQMISEALSGLNMTCDFLPVEGNTRINLKVVDPIAHTSTEINEPGVPVDPATLQSLLDHLLKLLLPHLRLLKKPRLKPRLNLGLRGELVRTRRNSGKERRHPLHLSFCSHS